MKQLMCGVILSLVVSVAIADVTESDIRQFEKGKTTYDQVVAKLGAPSRTEYNDEGFKAIVYVNQSTHLNSISTISLFGSLASLFMPGAAGLVASTGSLAAETVGGGAEGNNSITAFSFDKNGLLIYYRAVVSSTTVGTLNSKSSSKEITSEDGAIPLPNVKVAVTDEQRAKIVAPSDDKPRLGIQYVSIGFLEEKNRNDFAAAKFNGVIVTNVMDGSVAQMAGIQKDDYLYIVNGMLVVSGEDIAKAMTTVRKGDTIKARARRIDQNAHLYREQIFTLHF